MLILGRDLLRSWTVLRKQTYKSKWYLIKFETEAIINSDGTNLLADGIYVYCVNKTSQEENEETRVETLFKQSNVHFENMFLPLWFVICNDCLKFYNQTHFKL